jgi:hypothetical protein
MSPNPDTRTHVFRTFCGMPPDMSDRPICGATLTRAYDRPRGTVRPQCDACARILAATTRREMMTLRDHALARQDHAEYQRLTALIAALPFPGVRPLTMADKRRYARRQR